MHILISNDDGVHAPGIKILAKVLSEFAKISLVAPLEERSTTGHTLTLDHPLRMVQIEPGVYGCSGYPADCVLMGLGHLFKHDPPDLVVTGINRGANLGQDIYYSGTVAAAREATFHGVPAIAVSLVVDFQKATSGPEHHYESAAIIIKKLLEVGFHKKIAPMTVFNVNVPNLEINNILGIKQAILGFRKYSEDIEKRRDFRDRDYYWIGGIYKGFEAIENSDCQLIDQSWATLTCLNILEQSSDKGLIWEKELSQIKW